jgi:hypothetical protein
MEGASEIRDSYSRNLRKQSMMKKLGEKRRKFLSGIKA